MARITLKPLASQTVVLTGATSGIGLATARLLAERGAKLMLVARNKEALTAVRDELRGKGSTAEYVVADVADAAQVDAAAAKAIEVFGGFDTWVNDAGAFVYGRFDEIPLADQRRVFDVVYWGVVHGTLAAARHLKARGGAIVNVGSVLSEIAIPFQGPYCAAKFAVKGFTEAFRREVDAAKQPISLSLIKPAAIDTLFMEHARNRMGSPGTRNPPPAYHPHLVARAIAHACEVSVRDITVGGAGGGALVVANRLAPRAVDWVSARTGRTAQTTQDAGAEARRDNLYEPKEDLAERSSLHPFTRRTSLTLEAQLHPGATLAAVAGLGAIAMAAIGRNRRGMGRS